MIDPNGIAHIRLTARDVARSRPFYYRPLGKMGTHTHFLANECVSPFTPASAANAA